MTFGVKKYASNRISSLLSFYTFITMLLIEYANLHKIITFGTCKVLSLETLQEIFY